MSKSTDEKRVRQRREWFILTLLVVYVMTLFCSLFILREPERVISLYHSHEMAGVMQTGMLVAVKVVTIMQGYGWLCLMLMLVLVFAVVAWKGGFDRLIVPLIAMNVVFMIGVVYGTVTVKRYANLIIESEKKVYDQMKDQLQKKSEEH